MTNTLGNVNISVVMQDILQTNVRFSCVFINDTGETESTPNACTFGIQQQFMTHTMYSNHHLITQPTSENDEPELTPGPELKSEMYICPVCRKLLKTKKSLSIHVLIHYGKKRYKCSKCPSAYLYKASLKKHFRKHLPNPQQGAAITVTLPVTQVCNICLQTFRSQKAYQRHFNTRHTTKVKYICKMCAYKCYYSTQYKKHLKKYHM